MDMDKMKNLHQYKWRACFKLNRVVDSCENLEQLKLIENWVLDIVYKFGIDNYCRPDNPEIKLQKKLREFL